MQKNLSRNGLTFLPQVLFASLLAVLTQGTHSAKAAEPVYSFGVNYFVTNSAASGTSGSVTDRATGLWLGNLRGLETWRDLIIANKADNTVSIRLANDDGTFGTMTNYTVGTSPMGVRSADLNLDVSEDIVVANSGSGDISVLYNNGFGLSFAAATNFTVGNTIAPVPVAVTTADIDGSGTTDILVANSGEDTVSVLLGTNSSFALTTNYAVGANPQSVNLSDLNGDSFKDILTANKTAGTLTILTNNGAGIFSLHQTITLFAGGDPQPTAALTADFNGDGFLDIVTANYNSNSISILSGDGSGNFSLSTNIAVGTNPRSLVIRDLNRDGIYDVAVANEGSGTVNVFLNSNGTLIGGYTFTVGANPAAIVGSNLNGDSINDLAVANNGDNTVSILLYDLPFAYSATVNVLEDVATPFSLMSHVYPGRIASYTILTAPAFGTLTGTGPGVSYLASTNYFGPDSFTFKVNDGTSDSEVATITLNVVPVNDRPSFTVSTTSLNLQKYGAANSYPGLIATSSVGPANESSQTLSYVVSTTNRSFFSSMPVVNSSGTLTFKPSSSANGTAAITITARDNGGHLNGGIDTSSPISVNINMPLNPYPAIKGVYRGLFYESAAVKHESSGYTQISVTQYGTISGKIMIGYSYGFTGQFDATGTAVATVNRPAPLSALTVTLSIDLDPNGTQQITGTVSDGSWTANLTADRLVYSSSNLAPQAGQYTMTFPGGNDPSTSPVGDGYAVVKVTATGAIQMKGLLADGKSISQASAISKDGQWPLYVPLYAAQGSILSWITFTNQFNSSFAGNLSWIKTGAAGGSYYASGFTNDLIAIGSSFTLPGFGERIVGITNGLTFLSGGNLSSPLVNDVVLTTANKLTVTSGAATNLVLNIATNGVAAGSFKHPVTGVTTPIKGVVLQQQNTVGGYFLGPSQGGKFLLQSN